MVILARAVGWLLVLGAAVGRGAELEVVVRNAADVPQADAPVTVGVPWPEGALRNHAALRLLDRTGAARPLQVDVLSRWPDGSVKWALLDFQATVPRRGLAVFRLASAGPLPEAEALPAAIQVRDGERYLTVATGAATFRLVKDRFKLFEEVCPAGQELPVAAPYDEWDGLSLEFEGAGGPRVFLSSRGPATAEVESSGPLRAVVRFAGKLQAEGGAGWGDYVARLHFYAGRPVARLQLAVFNREKPPARPVADLTLRLPVRAEGLLRWAFAAEGGRLDAHPGTLRGPEDDAALVQRPAASRAASRYDVVQGRQTLASGAAAGGGVALWGATGGAALAVRRMAESNPKALRVRGTPRIELGISPREAGTRLELLPGQAVGCDVLLAFAAGAPPSPAELAAAFDAPLAAFVARPDDAARTQAPQPPTPDTQHLFSPLGLLGRGGHEPHFADDLARLEQALGADGSWGAGRYGAPLHQGCDATLALAREGLRRGEPRLLALAHDGALRLATAGTFHGAAGGDPRLTGGCYAPGATPTARPDPESSWYAGAWLAFLLIGDRAILDGALENAAFATRRADDPYASPLAAALAVLNLTHAADLAPRFAPQHAAAFEAALDAYLGKLLACQGLSEGGLPDPEGAVAIEALAAAHARKADPRIPPAILRAAEALARIPAPTPQPPTPDTPHPVPPLSAAAPWLARASEMTGDFRLLAKARRLERAASLIPAETLLDFALRYRAAGLFAAAWERHAAQQRAARDPALGLVCHFETAADIALPAQGAGGGIVTNLPRVRPFATLRAGPREVHAWFPLADSENVAETQGAIELHLSCRPASLDKGVAVLSSGEPREHGFELVLGRDSLELIGCRDGRDRIRAGGPIRLEADARHSIVLAWAPGPETALYFDGEKVAATRSARLGFAPHLCVPYQPGELRVGLLRIWRRPPAAWPKAPAAAPPAAITDLLLAPAEEGKAHLSWTAPAAGSKESRLARYYVRASSRPFRALSWEPSPDGGDPPALEQWAEADRLPAPMRPGPAGQLEKLLIGPLPKGRRTYIAVRSEDEAGNLSPLSNVVQVGPNHAPVAHAGPPLRQAIVGATVLFDGRGSSDPDGDELAYEWSNGLQGPTGSIRYERPGTHDVTLAVSDGQLAATAATRLLVGDTLRLSFQPRGFPRCPEGFVPDEGAAHAPLRGYGWRASPRNAPRGILREEPAGLAPEAATAVVFPGPAEWLCDLPPGTYDVTLALGGAASAAGQRHALIEGQAAVPGGQPGPLAIASVHVPVTDGQLNVQFLSPSGGEASYIIIRLAGPPPAP